MVILSGRTDLLPPGPDDSGVNRLNVRSDSESNSNLGLRCAAISHGAAGGFSNSPVEPLVALELGQFKTPLSLPSASSAYRTMIGDKMTKVKVLYCNGEEQKR